MSRLPKEENRASRSRWLRLCNQLWKVLSYFWKGIIWAVFLGSLPSILLLGPIQTLIVVHLWITWIIPHSLPAASILLGLIVLTVLSFFGGREDARHPSPATHVPEESEEPVEGAPYSLSRQDWSNRMDFLEPMYQDWIRNYLEENLEPKFWLELGLRDRPDLLPPNPLQVEYPVMAPLPSFLPPGTTIEQVYEQTRQGQLLIVGEPGSGKTTLFLHLARYLIKLAEQDKMQPIPAIFKLSSWAKKRLPLAGTLCQWTCSFC